MNEWHGLPHVSSLTRSQHCILVNDITTVNLSILVTANDVLEKLWCDDYLIPFQLRYGNYIVILIYFLICWGFGNYATMNYIFPINEALCICSGLRLSYLLRFICSFLWLLFLAKISELLLCVVTAVTFLGKTMDHFIGWTKYYVVGGHTMLNCMNITWSALFLVMAFLTFKVNEICKKKIVFFFGK